MTGKQAGSLTRRRLLATAVLLSASVARHAQAAERLVGWVSTDSRESTEPFLKAFRAGVAAGARGGADPVRIVARFANASEDAIPAVVADLERQGVRVIVAQGAATLPVVRSRPSVPVVYGFSADPVVAGIARSLARPGGGATGVSFMSLELNPKRIELVREVLPACRTIGLMSYARHAGEENEIVACQQAAQRMGIELLVQRLEGAGDLRPAVARAVDGGSEAIVMLPSGLTVQHAGAVAEDCLARRLPLVSGWSNIARSGALMTYGPSLQAAYERVAYYVLRILDGADPASLPIEQPTVFEFVINLKTARALGLAMPPALLARADEIIE